MAPAGAGHHDPVAGLVWWEPVYLADLSKDMVMYSQ